MATETFKVARERLFKEFAAHDWDVITLTSMLVPLKTPYVCAPRGEGFGPIRIWFKAQALYVSYGRPYKLTNARSLFSDYRGLTFGEITNAAIPQSGYGSSRF